jgi:xylulokinase
VIAWFDARTRPQSEWLADRFGRDHLFAITGLSLQPIWSLCKLLWLKDEAPDAWRRTVRWLHVADYVAYRLCGVPATDCSLASRTSAFDITARCWREDILRDCDVDPGILAPLVESGTRLDTVTFEASRATGLPTSAVVCAGGHDHVVGALGSGIGAPGQLLNSLGTAEAMFLPLRTPISDPKMGVDGYTQGCHVVPGMYYVFASQYTSGASITWFQEVVGDNLPIDVLIEEATAIPPGSYGVAFLPHLRLANPPYDDPRSRGAFVGLHTDTGRGALFRAVLEGLALESRQALQGLERYGGVTMPSRAIAIGGSSRIRLLMQIKASSLGLPYDVAEIPEATALGAAMLGGIGAGVYRDTADVVASVAIAGHRVEPDPQEAQLYDRLYAGVFRRLYPAIRGLSHAIDDFLSDTGVSTTNREAT